MLPIADQNSISTVRHLIALIQQGLESRPSGATKNVVSRLKQQSLGEADFVAQVPKTLPVTSQWQACISEAQKIDSALATQLGEIQPMLKWQQTSSYSDDVMGNGFLANYGWAELIGPSGFFAGDDFLLGLLMLGPNRHYRDHNHAAPELYWPLTPNSQWRSAPEGFAEKAAGEIIWHEPFQIHSTKTFEQPLLAVWVWTKDVGTPARLV